MVYVGTTNGPLRVWPEVHPGITCCGDRSPIQPLHLVSTVVGDCHRKTKMMCCPWIGEEMKEEKKKQESNNE